MVSRGKSPGAFRVTARQPIRLPSRNIGTASTARTPDATSVSRSRPSYAPATVISGTCAGSSVTAVRPTTPSPLRMRAVRRTSASASVCPVAARWSNASAASSYSKMTPRFTPVSWTARETIVVSIVSRSSEEPTA